MAARTSKSLEPVDIPAMNVKVAEIKLVSQSPLLSHRFPEKARKEILDKCQKKASTGREPKQPFREFMESLHWLTPIPKERTVEAFEKAVENGAKFGFPAVGIKQSAVSGAYRAGLTKDKVSIYGAFHVVGTYAHELDEKKRNADLVQINGKMNLIEEPCIPENREDYAVISNGAPEMRYRGEFKDWTMTFDIEYNADKYSLEQLINFFNYGGFAVGIGDWRVEKAGIHGRYKVAN